MTRAAYDASFAKLVSLVAYRDSRRSENQRVPRDLFYWLARFVFLSSVSASLGIVGEQFGKFHRRVIKTHQGPRNTSDPMIEFWMSPNVTDGYRILTCVWHETHTHREKELV